MEKIQIFTQFKVVPLVEIREDAAREIGARCLKQACLPTVIKIGQRAIKGDKVNGDAFKLFRSTHNRHDDDVFSQLLLN